MAKNNPNFHLETPHRFPNPSHGSPFPWDGSIETSHGSSETPRKAPQTTLKGGRPPPSALTHCHIAHTPQPLQPAHSAPRHKAPNYPAAPPHKPTQAPPPHGFLPAQIKKSPPRLVNSKYPLIFAPENKRERPHNKKGAIAQLVEQRTENPCVPGSIPGGTTENQRVTAM